MTFKSWILTSEKKDQVARIGVRGGLGDLGNARKKTFFSVDVFPNPDQELGLFSFDMDLYLQHFGGI